MRKLTHLVGVGRKRRRSEGRSRSGEGEGKNGGSRNLHFRMFVLACSRDCRGDSIDGLESKIVRRRARFAFAIVLMKIAIETCVNNDKA